MKLDYLKDGSADCPLLRLYEFNRSEAVRLHGLFNELATGKRTSVKLEMATSVDGTQLTLARGARDRDIAETCPRHFLLELSAEGWQPAADFVVPFTEGGQGYQWLTPQTRGIQLLCSQGGDW